MWRSLHLLNSRVRMVIYKSFSFSLSLVTLGQVIGGLNTRRGTIIDSEVRDDEFTAAAKVALNDMFGYSNQLRGSTQGKGGFSMEYKVRPFLLCWRTVVLNLLPKASHACSAKSFQGS
jgi:hypothetical protein